MSQLVTADVDALLVQSTSVARIQGLPARGLLKLLSKLCIAMLAVALVQRAQAVDLVQTMNFDIPPQALSTALIQFSHQTGIQIVVSDDIRGQTSKGIDGIYAIGDALRMILLGSGLNYRLAGDTSIVIGRHISGVTRKVRR